MKKLTMVALVLAMAFAMASSASALYIFNYQGNDAGGTSARGGVFGFYTSATALDWSVTPGHTAVSSAVLNVAGGVAGAGMTITNAYQNWRTTTDQPGSKWYVMLMAEDSFTQANMQVKLWAQTASALPAGMWDVSLLYNPITQAWGRQLLTPAAGVGSAAVTSAASPLFSYTVPTYVSVAPKTQWGYIFEVAPHSEVIIPEPGSMVALMSGLVGLIGFGIRRRK